MAVFYLVFMTLKKLNVSGRIQETERNLTLESLEQRILDPYRRAKPMVINGRTLHKDDWERIEIYSSEHEIRKTGEIPWQLLQDVTSKLVDRPFGWDVEADSHSDEDPRPEKSDRQVFVVHGRNGQARDALFAFLRAIGLHPLEWSEVTQATGKPTPYIGLILDTAFLRAHAVIVLFTPDDEARLNERLREENDRDYETKLTGQARPNVLFEAGMAMGRNNERTVLVELGQLRPFSDIEGLHVVRLDNSTEQRQELAKRLETAGCPVNWNGTDWHSVGDFEAAVRSIVPRQPETVAEAKQQSELEEKREYTQRTPEEITLEMPFDNEDSVSPDLGKWLRVDDPAGHEPITTMDPIQLTVVSPDGVMVALWFDNAKWRPHLANVKNGDRIVGEGRIAEVSHSSVRLHDCELLDIVE